VAELARVLVADGLDVALVSTAGGDGPLTWPVARPADLTILRRPNSGYDFGSWAIGLDRYPSVAGLDEVLLLNDSLAGPFASIDHLLAGFHDSAADVWTLTDTTQFGHHAQSYCLGFKRGVLVRPPLADFWREIRPQPSRDEVIWRYEIGLSQMLHREGYTIEAAIPFSRVVGDGQNPTILGWRRLLDEGFPFVKRQLLGSPDVAPDGADVRPELERRYGVRVDEWV
jgi:lipopolysaccharide biosynthesis protein